MLMLSALRQIVSGTRGRKLVENTLSLSAIQALDYILPLILIPYMLRTVGVEKYGVIAFAGSFSAYFRVAIDYGFNLTATRNVVLCRDNHTDLGRYFYTVTLAKSFLALCAIIAFVGVVAVVPVLRAEWAIYAWSMLATIGGCAFPAWFFQGMERMKYIAIFSIVSRTVAFAFYFVFIRKPSDFMWVFYLQSASAWIVAAVGMGVAVKWLGISRLPNLNAVTAELRGGFHVFVSQISVTLFTNTNTFILGLLTTTQMVGVYAASEKIVRAVIYLGIPIGGAVYPRAGALFAESTDKALLFLRRLLLAGGAGFLAASSGLFLAAPIAVRFIFGHDNDSAVVLVRVMSILPLSVFIDNVYGTQIMLNQRMEKGFSFTILCGGLLSLTLLIGLVPHLGPLGAAMSFLGSEIFCLACFYVLVRRAGLDPMAKIPSLRGQLLNQS